MQQLLQLGAACNVHYLFSMDTDQLTGPQVPEKPKQLKQLKQFDTDQLTGPQVPEKYDAHIDPWILRR